MRTTLLLWLAVTFLSSALTGVVGGILAHLAGDGLAEALITGAVAFAGAAGLFLAVLGFAMAYLRRSGSN
jgi:hypothetical protein